MHDDENLRTERETFVTHMECSATGERYPADELHNVSRTGKPLLVRYDLAGIRHALSKTALAQPSAEAKSELACNQDPDSGRSRRSGGGGLCDVRQHRHL